MCSGQSACTTTERLPLFFALKQGTDHLSWRTFDPSVTNGHTFQPTNALERLGQRCFPAPANNVQRNATARACLAPPASARGYLGANAIAQKSVAVRRQRVGRSTSCGRNESAAAGQVAWPRSEGLPQGNALTAATHLNSRIDELLPHRWQWLSSLEPLRRHMTATHHWRSLS